MHGGSDALAHLRRIASSSHRHGSLRPRTLREWNVNLGKAVAAQAAIVNVSKHADDLPFERRPQLGHARNQLLDHDALRERINSGEVALDENFIHHRHANATGRVLIS